MNKIITKLLSLKQIDTHPELPLDPDAVEPGYYSWPPHLIPSLQVIVFCGGCIGTISRYYFSIILPKTSLFPLSTFLINIFGAFLLGLLLESLTRIGNDSGILQKIRLGVGTGFLGAFTTYSALAVDTSRLYQNKHIEIAFIYLISTLIVGILFTSFGIYSASTFHKKVRVIKK